MSNQATDLDALHDAMKAAFAATFENCFVDFYPRPGEKITTPAILLEIEDILADDPDDIGTEQLAVTLNCNAYVVLSYKAGNKKALKKFAAAVMAYTRARRWGQPVGPANVVGANPDTIVGQPDDYECMRVEFSHAALLGTDVFAGAGVIPTEIYLGFSPLIGPDHIDDYMLVTEIPEL